MSHGFLKEASTCVIEEPADVRFDHPVVSPKLQRDRQCVDRIKGTNMWPIAIATAQEVLLVDGRESPRDRQLHQRILHHWHPQWPEASTPFRNRVSSDEFGTVACALETLHKVLDVVLQVVRVLLGTHPVHAVGRVLLDRPPTVSQHVRIEHPIEVPKPILLLAFCLLCSALQGGWHCGPTLHVRAMFPVQAPYACPPLPRVIGSPVSEYSERI